MATIVEFTGKAFDKTIVKARGVKYMAKTFTLPDVQVGCILEYYYTIDLSEYTLFNSRWILSDELFTKNAKFSLKPLHQQLRAHQRPLDMEPTAARNRPAGRSAESRHRP